MNDMNEKALIELQDIVHQTPEIPEHKRKQIMNKIEQVRSPLDTDKMIYRIVVGSLGTAVLICVTFSFLLVWQHASSNTTGDVKIPDIFMAIGSAAVGALAGLLAPSPVHKS